MRERDIEKKLVKGVKKLGGECLKWISPGTTGVPDRIVILPSGDIFFVELKAESGRLSGQQDYWQFRLKELNCSAVVLYGFDQVDWFLKRIGPYAWTDEIRDMITSMVEEGNE